MESGHNQSNFALYQELMKQLDAWKNKQLE